jgi:hypothetical protein
VDLLDPKIKMYGQALMNLATYKPSAELIMAKHEKNLV